MCIPRRSGLGCIQPWTQWMGLGVLLFPTPSFLLEAAFFPRAVYGWLTPKEEERSVYLNSYTHRYAHKMGSSPSVNLYTFSFGHLLIQHTFFEILFFIVNGILHLIKFIRCIWLSLGAAFWVGISQFISVWQTLVMHSGCNLVSTDLVLFLQMLYVHSTIHPLFGGHYMPTVGPNTPELAKKQRITKSHFLYASFKLWPTGPSSFQSSFSLLT